MNWDAIAILVACCIPPVGFAVKGLIQYVTSGDGVTTEQGKLSMIWGVAGTIFVIVVFVGVCIVSSLTNGIDNPEISPLPTPPSESLGEVSSEPTDNIFRPDMVCAGGIYTGYLDPVNEEPNGKGIMEYFNGDKYNGDWKDGHCHGNGEMTYSNGDVYSGEWECGTKNGYGVYTWRDGREYRGSYKDDLRDGKGEYHGWSGYTAGLGEWRGTYYGTSVGDVFEGYGTFEFDNGDHFEGIFHNNEFWQGTFTYHDGAQKKIDRGPIE